MCAAATDNVQSMNSSLSDVSAKIKEREDSLRALNSKKRAGKAEGEKSFASFIRVSYALQHPLIPLAFAVLAIGALQVLGADVEAPNLDALTKWVEENDPAAYSAFVNTWVPFYLAGLGFLLICLIGLMRRRKRYGTFGSWVLPTICCVLGNALLARAIAAYADSPLFESAQSEVAAVSKWFYGYLTICGAILLVLILVPWLFAKRAFREKDDADKRLLKLDAEIDQSTSELVLLRKRRDDLSSDIRREKARQEAEARAEAERARAEAERARAEAELAKKRGLALRSAQQGLDSLVGLAGVKNRIEDWRARIAFDRENGNKASKAPLNMLFLGNPGTGKTEVARIMGKLMFGLGLLPTSSVVEVSRGDLVEGYIGQTAVKTKKQIAMAMGGVLFVDEAYTLMPKDDGRDFGHEALEEIMKAMEDHRGELAVIFAGYEKDMARLFDVNQGLESRFPKSNRIHFEDYSADELLEILKRIMRGNYSLEIEAEGEPDLLNYLSTQIEDTSFSNARGARNLADDLYNAQARLSVSGVDSRSGVLSCKAIRAVVGDSVMKSVSEEGLRAMALDKARAKLNAMIGLGNIKEWVDDWIAQIKFDRRRGVSVTPSLNMLFLGNAGTGKTEVARVMGQIMYGLGLLPTSSVVEVSRGDLIGQYIGETPVKTKEQIARAMGGVLFVDEAYTLMPKDDGRDFGREALEEIMKAMEDHRGELAVIFAGYSEDMQRLFSVNQGLASRFPEDNRVVFYDYSEGEKLTLLHLFLKNREHLEVPSELDARLAYCLELLKGDGSYANARGVRTVAESLHKTQAIVASRIHLEDEGTLSPEAIDLWLERQKRGGVKA